MKTVALREDVAWFAEKMEKVMDVKDREKGPIEESFTFLDAMQRLQAQYAILMEHGAMGDTERVKRILVHIANFCMIAEYKLK